MSWQSGKLLARDMILMISPFKIEVKSAGRTVDPIYNIEVLYEEASF